MSLTPLLEASPIIMVHAFAAFAAIALGATQLMLPKGSPRHKAIGSVWAGLMCLIAVSSLFIHTIRTWGPFSPIHLLSVFVLINLPYRAWLAYHGQMRGHGKHMAYNFAFALIVAGFFTFAPGRIMHAVLFGS